MIFKRNKNDIYEGKMYFLRAESVCSLLQTEPVNLVDVKNVFPQFFPAIVSFTFPWTRRNYGTNTYFQRQHFLHTNDFFKLIFRNYKQIKAHIVSFFLLKEHIYVQNKAITMFFIFIHILFPHPSILTCFFFVFKDFFFPFFLFIPSSLYTLYPLRRASDRKGEREREKFNLIEYHVTPCSHMFVLFTASILRISFLFFYISFLASTQLVSFH